jgi:hypothetical protein
VASGAERCGNEGKMMRQHLLIRETLRFLLAVLGVTALLIALSNLLLGPGFTAGAAERAFDAFTGWQGPSSAPWQPTMDNELRFYSALWGGYGIAMLATARNLDAYLRFVPWLAVVFFVGGVGRAISWVQVGAPHPLFLNLMAIELIVPPIFLLLYVLARMATTANSK